MKKIPDTNKLRQALFLSPLLALPLAGQPVPSESVTDDDPGDVVVLSPFEVSSEADTGYRATATLAGNRLNTELRDIGNAVTVITSQFLQDIAATSNESLLQYTVGTEVGNVQGNFAGVGDGAQLNESFTNPNANTRVRGLAEADNTRDFFLSDIPWDGYNVDGVDLQRGPNSILFGQGSPAGLINTRTKIAGYRNSAEAEVRVASYGSVRASLDINRVILPNELAIRVAAVHDDEQFQQEPAFEEDQRIFAALRYEPSFLKRGSARTILKANFETGDIESNRPRAIPPVDLLSPWFYTGTYQGRWASGGTYRDPATGEEVQVNAGDPRTFNHLNRETFDPFQLQDDNTGTPNHGQQRPSINGGYDAGFFNPYYNPRIGNFAQSFGGPLAYFTGNGAAPDYMVSEIRQTRAIGPDGEIDGGLGYAFHRQGGIAPEAAFARSAGLPYGEFGIYKNYQLTDPTIFDFYNKLIDGPNKREWADFRAFNVSLAQTFMNDKFGFDLTFNTEEYENGALSLITDTRQAIHIDFMDTLTDGQPNPNVGRPFISDSGQFGNNSYQSERDNVRLTGFFKHNFEDGSSDALWRRILGRHTITGLLSQDDQETENRGWQRWAILDQEYRDFVGAGNNVLFTDNLLAPNPVIYLGPSLLDRSTASGANLPGITEVVTPSSGQVRIFDSTWNRPTDPSAPGYVDPAAVWEDPYYPDVAPFNLLDDPTTEEDETGARWSTQSENPANYVGWRDVPLNITDSENSQEDRDALTTNATKRRNHLSSRALVLQSHLWDNSVVVTYGYREDIVKNKTVSLNTSNTSLPYGQLDLRNLVLPDEYNPDTRVEEASKAYSIVAHLNQLPFVGGFVDRLPINVSLMYNRSTNFQPESARVDVYGEPIPLPQGLTYDRGILLETKDGRYSLKVTKFETRLTNANSSALGGAWFIGASQAWSGNWVNRFEYNFSGGDTIDFQVPNPDPTNSEYNYAPGPGETLADAQAREAAAIAAWRTWQASVDPRFYEAWSIDLNDLTKPVTANNPANFALTEDSVSKGYEFEFNAEPLRNWRLTFNAAKITASRSNIGGAALAEFIGAYENALRNTAAGDLRIWWGGAGNETALFQWNSNAGAEWTSRRLQEGTNVPELREWRFNAITNYDFTEGMLAGFNVGLGVRWQDEVVIGYPPLPGETPDQIGFDIANPYMGPDEMNFDFWIGYSRKITDRIDWRVQLNVRNAFEDDGLIPVTTQPDGTPAGYRIAPSQIWSLTNTFRF